MSQFLDCTGVVEGVVPEQAFLGFYLGSPE